MMLIWLDLPHIAKGSFGIVYTGKVTGVQEKIVIKDMSILAPDSVAEWKKELVVMRLVYFLFYYYYFFFFFFNYYYFRIQF
jgi:hypothetical protein